MGRPAGVSVVSFSVLSRAETVCGDVLGAEHVPTVTFGAGRTPTRARYVRIASLLEVSVAENARTTPVVCATTGHPHRHPGAGPSTTFAASSGAAPPGTRCGYWGPPTQAIRHGNCLGTDIQRPVPGTGTGL
ncbi:hypothetical protein F4561_000507 [Lipingzhangella halophila]|uniref:Uncharacterized protein n=1 Tax=Lipingzhangella halophila TaxID=1783352 RepID=A0A7W7RCW7_9ACTN|nr:hypothetical protein [Lipingzhangella halophila]